MITDLEQRIVFEDDDLLIVDKPPFLPTSGKHLEDDDCLQYWLIRRHGGMIWAVHQLDADTTGITIFAKRKELVPIYHNSLRQANSSKRYLAIVHGNPNWNEWDERSPIGKISHKSLGVTAEGKSAHSKFAVLGRTTEYSLIEARIFTGRTHQIRIHLSHLGYPLVGEEWYRSPPCTLHPRQALHAYQITLLDPVTCRFTAPLAADLIALADSLGLSLPARNSSEPEIEVH